MSGAPAIERSLEISTGAWGIAALVVLGIVAALVVRRSHALESAGSDRLARVRATGLALRLSTLAAAAFLLARPAVRTIAVEPIRPRIVLLEDRSASVAEGAGIRAVAETGDAIAAAMGGTGEIERVPFDSPAGEALDAAAGVGDDVRAIVLLTDARDFEPPLSAGIPVFALTLETPAERLALVLPDVPARSLRGDPLALSVRLVASGLAGRDVDLEARDGDRVLASRRVRLGSDRFDERVGLSTAALAPGLHTIALVASLPNGPSDRALVAVDVVDERLRVLYVEDQPRWTYRFLKTALLRDPSIAARCLLLSADPDFPQEASPGEAPLAGFPSREDLERFDVILLGDIDPAKLGAPDAPASLRHFVEERGGGIALLCGPRHAPSRLRGTPLEDCLPATLLGGEARWRPTAPFALRLTPRGRMSEILRLLGDDAENVAFLEGRSEPEAERPPGFTGYAPLGAVKPGAVVLAEHPIDRAPLLLTQWFGSGRVLLLAIDDLWRWRFGAEDLLFYRFMGQSIRFLADVDRLAGEESGRAVPDRREYRPGELVRLRWRGAGPPAALEVHGDSGAAVRVPLDRGEAMLSAGAPGIYGVRPEEGGRESAFRVAVPPRERTSEPDLEALRRYVAATGGACVTREDLSTLSAKLPQVGATRRIDRGIEPLASFASTFWLLAALLSVEWTLRRWSRLA